MVKLSFFKKKTLQSRTKRTLVLAIKIFVLTQVLSILLLYLWSIYKRESYVYSVDAILQSVLMSLMFAYISTGENYTKKK